MGIGLTKIKHVETTGQRPAAKRLLVPVAGCSGVRPGRFSSSGYGPVPASVLARVAHIDAAIERTDDLPVIGPATEVPAELSGDYNPWILMSEKGLYA